jgi:hypothetical protein
VTTAALLIEKKAFVNYIDKVRIEYIILVITINHLILLIILYKNVPIQMYWTEKKNISLYDRISLCAHVQQGVKQSVCLSCICRPHKNRHISRSRHLSERLISTTNQSNLVKNSLQYAGIRASQIVPFCCPS